MKNPFRRSKQPPSTETLAAAPEQPDVPEFEQALLAYNAAHNMKPAWQKFAETYFYVAVITNDSGATTNDFRFHVAQNKQDGKPYITIAEKLHNLGPSQQNRAIREIGGKLIATLNPAVGIAIALDNGKGVYCMPPGLLGLLRSEGCGVQP